MQYQPDESLMIKRLGGAGGAGGGDGCRDDFSKSRNQLNYY